MNNLDYLNSISGQSEMANVSLEGIKKPKMKYIIFAILGIIAIVAIAVLAVSVMQADNEDNAGEDEDYSLQDDTGGEEVELAEDESLNFLTEYGLSEIDASDADWGVIKYLGEYYAEDGFNYVKYDLDSVVLSAENNSLSFTFSSDRADVKFQATLSLDPNDNSMKDISISPITAD